MVSVLRHGEAIPALGLRRSARLPVMAALHGELKRPILLLTDRMDHAMTLFEELGMWSPAAPRYLFPEPTPLFYEEAAWGEATRRDRLIALTILAAQHIPGAPALLPSAARHHRPSTRPDDPNDTPQRLFKRHPHLAPGTTCSAGSAGT